MKKRILSLVLALVLALSLLPTTVFAASYTFNEKATIFTQNFTTTQRSGRLFHGGIHAAFSLERNYHMEYRDERDLRKCFQHERQQEIWRNPCGADLHL